MAYYDWDMRVVVVACVMRGHVMYMWRFCGQRQHNKEKAEPKQIRTVRKVVSILSRGCAER